MLKFPTNQIDDPAFLLTPDSSARPAAQIFKLDPLHDARWSDFVDRTKGSSIFHTREWLKALQQTFGYEPVVFTTSRPGEELRNSLQFCYVNSWLTGNRLVSLPFSDHCQPLGSAKDVSELLRGAVALADSKIKYIEVRPLTGEVQNPFREAEAFWLHRLDLRPDLVELHRCLHKSSIQRTIKRAQRRRIEIDQGREERHVKQFYRLFVLTRRRFHLPPQPFRWFRNLVGCLGEKLQISIASLNERPIAAIITLKHKNVVTYKYGASDSQFHSFGAVSLLFWNAICEAKQEGAEEFDFGRTAIENRGLATFKKRWGSDASELLYWRCGKLGHHKWESRPAISYIKRCVKYLPDPVLIGVGNLLYRHIG